MEHDSVGITHIDDVEESEDAYPAPFDGEKLSTGPQNKVPTLTRRL
jgi:hypothetical protein